MPHSPTAREVYDVLHTTKIKMANSYNRFYSNCKLAMVVSVWITVFGALSYNRMLRELTFGVPYCEKWEYGWVYHVPQVQSDNYRRLAPMESWVDSSDQDLVTPRSLRGNADPDADWEQASSPQPSLEKSTKTDLSQPPLIDPIETETPLRSMEDASGEKERTWCGYLPGRYLTNWSNVVMTILFTVYLNTGTTIHNTFRTFSGLFLAVSNYWVMFTLYPQGANNWFVWLDTLGFLLLLLLSNMSENVMKFAMSTHCGFMMTFLTTGPNEGDTPLVLFGVRLPHASWDSNPATMVVTGLMGCFLAVAATVFPPPALLNYRHVYGTADNIVQAYSSIWSKSTSYFCGTGPGVMKSVLKQAIDDVIKMSDEAIGDLDASWWESFDLFGQGRRRRLYMAFYTSMKQMEGVMTAVKDAMINEDFGGHHKAFCEAMRPRMESLQDSACRLLDLCQKACEDGTISEDERDDLLEGVDEVREEQLRLATHCREVIRTEDLKETHLVSKDLLNETVFLFGLSVFAEKVTDLAELIANIDDSEDTSALKSLCKTIREGYLEGCAWPDQDRVIFACRNWIVIAVCFVLGYFVECKKCVFSRHDAGMAQCMCFLINHYSGSAFLNNIKKILGIVIGKILPILVVSLLDPENEDGIFEHFSCAGNWGSLATASIVFTFTWFFTYMYYTSANWGGIGCFVAAFGCGSLVKPCGTVNDDYSQNYKVVAQDVFAILLALSLDMGIDVLLGKLPRDSAVQHLEQVKDGLMSSTEAFFEGDLDGLEKELTTTRGKINHANTYAYEADPALQMLPGIRADFKIDLYTSVLRTLKSLAGDLSMLVLATKGWEVLRAPEDGNDKSQWVEGRSGHESTSFDLADFLSELDSIHESEGGRRAIKDELLEMMELVLGTVQRLLAHGKEDNNFQDDKLTLQVVSLKTGGYDRNDDLYKEILSKQLDSKDIESVVFEPKARVTVVVKSLEDVREKLLAIEHALSEHLNL